MSMRSLFVLLPVAAVLAGCVTTPTAPAVRVLPGSSKSLDQFQADDMSCRQYAYNAVGGPDAAQHANNAAWGDVAVGSALDAAVGAIIGAAGGQAGHGAAIGAGMGLLGGSAAGSNQSGYSQYSLQRDYDGAYLQCMYARGHQVPGRVAYRSSGSAPAGSAPGYSPGYYPPPNYPPPASTMPGAPPATNAPPSYPPPNTPPPRS